MKTIFAMLFALTLVSPAFAGDDNNGNHNGRDDGIEAAATDEPKERNENAATWPGGGTNNACYGNESGACGSTNQEPDYGGWAGRGSGTAGAADQYGGLGHAP